MTTKTQEQINKEIDKLRKKFGRPPLKEQKTYKQRLEEHKNE